ncbi:uncharacterized protein LOC122383814 [Amphibalanus amphitrite]|uniref:uncharacterized protein LOC122383814 n=1 Tax=Amphibalanus amphitrite TaxID=1232801 RepID=UPI001C9016CF|nr:uncharacterized protein LOC122383814 [Amphibalanus amphitrite]
MLKHIAATSGGTMERRPANGDVRHANGGPQPAPRLNGTLPNRSNYPHVHNATLRSNGGAHGFNVSAYSTVSKHSQTSGSVSPGQTATTRTTGLDQSRDQSQPSVDISALTALNASAATRLDVTGRGDVTLPPPTPAAAAAAAAAAAGLGPSKRTDSFCERLVPPLPRDARVKRMLCCLGLLCLSSLLLAILASIFLLKVTPLDVDEFSHLISGYRRAVDAQQYIKLYEVTVALSALSVCLNLCCLLVCAIQFVLCIKLSKPPGNDDRTGAYLQESSPSRVFAMVGYFLSIPVFLTGVVLYTFLHFHSTSAITTSVFLGLGILFCGGATAHNIAVWHRVKHNRLARQRAVHLKASTPSRAEPVYGCRDPGSPGMPAATLDLSRQLANISNIHELSTLV